MSRCDTPKSEKVATVPNQPKTPVRTVRIADEIWAELKKRAAAQGVTASDLLREALEKFLR